MAQQSNNSKYVNPYEVTPDKPFHIAFLREITDQYDAGEISYGRMVEMLNEVAMKWHNSIIGKNEPTISKMETVKTAVEWLIGWMSNNQYFIGDDLLQAFKQAKQMEKEQIINAFENGIVAYDDPDRINDDINFDAENYYNETYGSNNQI